MSKRYFKSKKGINLLPKDRVISNYCAANRSNQSLYYLDTGMWWAIIIDKGVLLDPEELPKFIMEECFPTIADSESDLPKISDLVYNRIAPDLIDFCQDTNLNDLFIINNKMCDLSICRSLKYKFTGHRFYEKNSEEYFNFLNDLNSHLTSNSTEYNPLLYKGHPNFHLYLPDKLKIFL